MSDRVMASPAENEKVVRDGLEAWARAEWHADYPGTLAALAALRAQAEAGERAREAREILDEPTVVDFVRQFDRWKGSDKVLLRFQLVEALDFAMYVIERLRAALPARAALSGEPS